MNWSWFKVPVKVEQISVYLFSDSVLSKKKRAVNDVKEKDCKNDMRWWNKHMEFITTTQFEYRYEKYIKWFHHRDVELITTNQFGHNFFLRHVSNRIEMNDCT